MHAIAGRYMPPGNSARTAKPSSDDAKSVGNWVISFFTDGGGVLGRVSPSASISTNDQYAIAPWVTLPVEYSRDGTNWKGGFPPDTTQYTVTYTEGGEASVPIRVAFRKPALPDTKTSSDSDLTLFGGINAAVGARPTYKIDAALDVHPLYNGFGVVGTVKTDSRRNVDPDSFSGKLDYRYLLATPSKPSERQVIFQGAELIWEYAGVEFDRKGQNLNFVSSPYVLLPFTFHASADGKITNSAGLDFKLGIEAGHNFRNSLAADGYGGFMRTLAGTAANLTLRTVPGFSKVVFASSYEVRLPDKAELFGTSDAAGNTTYVFSKKARHWVSSSVSFFFNDHWAFTAEHSYGALPPAFKFTDQQVSLGLKFALKDK